MRQWSPLWNLQESSINEGEFDSRQGKEDFTRQVRQIKGQATRPETMLLDKEYLIEKKFDKTHLKVIG